MLRSSGSLVRSLHTFADAAKCLFPSVAKFNELIAERGEGCYIWDTEGRKYLDFTSGIGVVSTGHCHPKVVDAISKQAGRLIFAQQNILPVTPPALDLLTRLQGIVPDELTRFFFCQSGSEAVDNALKLARSYTGRQNVISFSGGYHGRTYGAMSITTSKTIYRQTFGPLPSGVAVAPYPYCLHCKARIAAGGMGHTTCEVPPVGPPYETRKCCNGPLEDLSMMLKMETHPKDTAAIIIEPILGEGGFLVPPAGFLRSLRELCDKHGIILIFDEVQCGMGRTGTWWGHQAITDVQPDVLIFAKGIASGFPFAGLAAQERLLDGMEPGMMGGTYGQGPMGCAAAAATIDVIKEESLLENARQRGEQLTRGLATLAEEGAPIAEIRGRGLMLAAELRGEPGVAGKVVKAAAERGVLFLTCGARETLRFLPPLVVTESQVEDALEVFKVSLLEVTGSGK